MTHKWLTFFLYAYMVDANNGIVGWCPTKAHEEGEHGEAGE